jgi:hypothetical protein
MIVSMQTPMVGSWMVDVKAVRPFTIHGDAYHELLVLRVDAGREHGMVIRVPQHAFGAGVTPGPDQRWELTFLMGQVTAARRVDTP